MKNFIIHLATVVILVSLCSCKPAVAKKAVKVTKEFLENHPKAAAAAVTKVYKKTYKCTYCQNGKIQNHVGFWVECNKCSGKGWYISF